MRLRITSRAESIVRAGHPWLFSDSIIAQNREGELGEIGILYDRKDQFLGLGLYDPFSPIRLRVLHIGKPETLDSAWWEKRLMQAVGRRSALFDANTTGYRLCHGENDGWPGFVLDRYATTLVLKLYTGAWLMRLDELLNMMKAKIPSERIVLRLSRHVQRAISEKKIALTGEFKDGIVIRGNALSEPVVFQESSLYFEADVLKGQKTGFFLDQRENRRLVESLSKGRHVLNAFSFSGGFSLYAARGGAHSVTDLDISQHALESAKRNFALNKDTLKKCPHELIRADAFDWLGKKKAFDLVILDPPSLAKKELERQGAIQAYQRLVGKGIHSLRKGGILVAGSCSAHVSASEFFDAVKAAARQSARDFDELQTTGHPPDHQAIFPEAEYLKCIYLKFRS